jgi:hypothetical protein
VQATEELAALLLQLLLLGASSSFSKKGTGSTPGLANTGLEKLHNFQGLKGQAEQQEEGSLHSSLLAEGITCSSSTSTNNRMTCRLPSSCYLHRPLAQQQLVGPIAQQSVQHRPTSAQ